MVNTVSDAQVHAVSVRYRTDILASLSSTQVLRNGLSESLRR